MFRSRLAIVSPKPILKRAVRPAPLPIARSPRSPHVHFPLSPGLFATFSTHSPSTYDRAPYPLSPPPALAVPGTFKLADPPKRNIPARPPAPILEENDPRSPRPAGSHSFAAAATALSRGSEAQTELGTALKGYPRSPYPSAPLSPAPPESDSKPRARSNSAGGALGIAPPRRPSPLVLANAHDRADMAGGATGSGTGTITFQFTSSRRLAPPHLDLTAARMPPYLTPVQESALSGGIEVELDVDKTSDVSSGGDSTRLSNAFWHSVSFQLEPGQEGPLASIADHASVSDGGFPESVTGSQPSVSSDRDFGGLTLLMSPRPKVPQFGHTARDARVPLLVFGRSDGSVWSPESPGLSGLNSPAPWVASPRPGGRMNSNLAVPRSVVAAPSPNDPFAKFPSFAAVLEMDVRNGARMGIKPPPRAHLPCEH